MKVKSVKFNLFAILIAVFFALSCERKHDEVAPKASEKKMKVTYEKIDPLKDQRLLTLLENYQLNTEVNARALNFDFGEIDATEAIKVENPFRNITRYSLLIADDDDVNFENVVFRDQEGEIYSYIMRYEPDPTWLIQNEGEFDIHSFTGRLLVMEMDRSPITEVDFVNGQGRESNVYGGKSGRTNCGDSGGSSGGSSGGGSSAGDPGVPRGGGGGSSGGATGGSGGTSGGTGGTSGGGSGGSGKGGGGGTNCSWSTSSNTGGLIIDCGLDRIYAFLRTACDPGFGDINLCDLPEIRNNPEVECPEDPIGIMPKRVLLAYNWELENVKVTDAFKNDPCMMEAFNAVDASNAVYNVLKDFRKTVPAKFQIVFDVKDKLTGKDGDPINGQCSAPDVDGRIVITMNKSQASIRTPLMVARTMVHEVIHAEIYRQMKSNPNYGKDVECGLGTPSEFEELWCYYQKYGDHDGQHEFMADHYVDVIAESLEEMHDELSTQKWIDYRSGGDWSWEEFFKYTAWGGLQETEEFENQIENDPDLYKKYGFYETESKGDDKCK